MSREEQRRRWRLLLGHQAEASLLGSEQGKDVSALLSSADEGMDRVLQALYDSDRKAGLGSSSPHVNRWLGDIRTYFPAPVVRILQRDAIERLNLQKLLLEKETLENITPDVHLVSTLISLKNVIPQRTRETARGVVRKVVQDLEHRLRQPLTQAIRGALHQASRTNRPHSAEIDWHRTIRKNLKNYQPDLKTLIADQLVGHQRKSSSLRDVFLCVDQSGSMAASIVYASVYAAVLASLRSINTRFVVFDTAVVDLTDALTDPVEVLFGTQLGGGTDIHRAVTYCQQVISKPSQSILVLVSDLHEGGDKAELLRRMAQLVMNDVTVIILLALSNDGTPNYEETIAHQLASLGIPCFACTPSQFPGMMAAAIQKQDISRWAATEKIVLKSTLP